MRRREFIIRLGGVALVWPRSLIAQSTDRPHRIGVLWGWAATDPLWQERFGAFTQGLQELGWVEGKNVSFEIRHAVGEPDQPSALAASLVAANVDVIVVSSAGLADVARKVTSTIPIVAVAAGDLEGTGLVVSLRRPGGNVTGLQVLPPPR
jgi:putative tryptophan/tyrosine transport system substrate-binding protein